MRRGVLGGVVGILGLGLSGWAADAQETQSYFYDVHGRLTAVTRAPANGGYRTRYGLDAADNRASEARQQIPAKAAQHTLQSGDGLLPSQFLRSADNRFTFALQGDGNAVIYGPTGALWGSGTATGQSTLLSMQGDGNLVIYGPSNNALWASGTSGHPGARLSIQNDGNLVIYDGATALWASGTGGH